MVAAAVGCLLSAGRHGSPCPSVLLSALLLLTSQVLVPFPKAVSSTEGQARLAAPGLWPSPWQGQRSLSAD